MIRSIFLLIILVFSQQSLDAAPTATRMGSNFVIRDGRTKIVIPNVVDEYTIYCTIHAVQVVGRDCYLVYGILEPSKPGGNGSGHCGAGTEAYIRWLHIQDGKVIEEKKTLYESCFKNLYYDSPIAWKDGKLRWTALGVERDEKNQALSVDYYWTYDPAYPEAGITEIIVKAPLRPYLPDTK